MRFLKIGSLVCLIVIGVGAVVLWHPAQKRHASIPPAMVAMGKLEIVKDLLVRYQQRHGAYPESIAALAELAADSRELSALSFNQDRPESDRWIYFREAISSSKGMVLVVSPVVYNTSNSELSRSGVEGVRVVLYSDGSIDLHPASELAALLPSSSGGLNR